MSHCLIMFKLGKKQGRRGPLMTPLGCCVPSGSTTGVGRLRKDRFGANLVKSCHSLGLHPTDLFRLAR